MGGEVRDVAGVLHRALWPLEKSALIPGKVGCFENRAERSASALHIGCRRNSRTKAKSTCVVCSQNSHLLSWEYYWNIIFGNGEEQGGRIRIFTLEMLN